MWRHASAGDVTVLGETLGRADVRRLRERIDLASASMADMLRDDMPVVDVVMTARDAALETWWHSYAESDRDFGTLSPDENRWSRRLMILLAMRPSTDRQHAHRRKPVDEFRVAAQP